MNSNQDPFCQNELHTERLSEKYGPILINVVSQNKNIRLSELLDTQGVLRTYAITIFNENKLSNNLNVIHEEIRNGSPIGETIKKFGFEIAKRNRIEFVINTPNVFKSVKLITSGQFSQIYCGLQDKLEYYADICEIYCPDFVEDTSDFVSDITSKEKIKDILNFANIIPIEIKIKRN